MTNRYTHLPFFNDMGRLILFPFAVFALIIAGCDNGQPARSSVSGVIDVRTADAEIVLAKLGNRSVTCGDFRKRLDFECAIWRLRHSKNKFGQKELDAFCVRRMPNILPTLVNQIGLSQWADEKNISLNAEERAKTEQTQLQSIGFKGDVAAFSKKTECSVAYISSQLCASSLAEKIFAEFEPASTNLTETEIDEGLARMAAYYDRAIASNAVTWATCSNVIAKVHGGLAFAQAARQYGYDNVEEGEDWGTFMPVEIEDAKLKEWAFSAPVGSLKIFELDDGISIVKICGREGEGSVQPIVQQRDSSVALARINFAMVEPEPEPRTREHVREALLRWKRRNAQKRLWAEISKRYPVSYPNEKAKLAYK